METHRIQHRDLYRAAYEALQASPVKVDWVSEQGHWFHAAPVKYGAAAVKEVQLLRPDSAAEPYRWSGTKPAPAGEVSIPGQPSKYFSRSVGDALIGEITSRICGTSLDADVRRMVNANPKEAVRLTPSGFSAALLAQRIVVLKILPRWKFADLSFASESGEETWGRILRLLHNTPSVKKELQKAGYQKPDLEALKASGDHSLASAIGHYLWDSRPNDPMIAGIKVPSMQSDAGLQYGDPDGDNIVAIGAENSLIHALKPVNVMIFESAPDGSVRCKTKPFPLPDKVKGPKGL